MASRLARLPCNVCRFAECCCLSQATTRHRSLSAHTHSRQNWNQPVCCRAVADRMAAMIDALQLTSCPLRRPSQTPQSEYDCRVGLQTACLPAPPRTRPAMHSRLRTPSPTAPLQSCLKRASRSRAACCASRCSSAVKSFRSCCTSRARRHSHAASGLTSPTTTFLLSASAAAPPEAAGGGWTLRPRGCDCS